LGQQIFITIYNWPKEPAKYCKHSNYIKKKIRLIENLNPAGTVPYQLFNNDRNVSKETQNMYINLRYIMTYYPK